MKKRMIDVTWPLLMKVIIISVMVSPIAWATGLSSDHEKKGIVVGTAIKLDARTAQNTIGKKGIIMGTCRQLERGST